MAEDANTPKLFFIFTQPGVKKDGSQLAGNYYIDGQWMRFQRGLPRKIGGYKSLVQNYPYIARTMYVFPQSPNFNVYLGSYATFEFFQIDQDGTLLGPTFDRTPAGFVVNNNNLWQIDLIYDPVSANNVILAHCAPNLSSISNYVNTVPYFGPSFTGIALDPIPTAPAISGGLVVLHPFVFLFGNDGYVTWSSSTAPLNFTPVIGQNFPGTARISATKVVVGKATRGGNSSPAGLFWTLNSLVRVTLVGIGTGQTFRFDTITDQSSILSSSCVIEYDSQYYWAGVDRFLKYNGIVQELPNKLNLDFFYQNLNYDFRQKVWATKVPEFGEIWWFYPNNQIQQAIDNTNAQECNCAVIYNIRENTWYDTQINRSAGYFEQVFSDPIWADNQQIPDMSGEYNIWMHEEGLDQNILGVLTAIDSYFETGDIAWAAIGPTGSFNGIDRMVDLERVEPDFWKQSGDLTLSVNGRAYANSPVTTNTYTIPVGTLKVDMREQRRFMTLKFDSNSIGGFYELGQTLLYIKVGDQRPGGNGT